MVGQKRRKVGSLALKITISLVVFVVMFAILDSLSTRFLPNVTTHDDMMARSGQPYPAAFSDYLPFTLPPDATFTTAQNVVYQFNKFGYRGPSPTSIEKPSNTRRVLFMGDSFVLGWGVNEEDTFIARIRSSLKDHQPAVELINAGYHDGYSPDAYYAYFRKEGIMLQPDVAVVVIYLGNDIADMANTVWMTTDSWGAPLSLHSTRQYFNYQGKLLDPRTLPWNLQVPILNNSRLFVALSNGLIDRFSTDAEKYAASIGLSQPSLSEEDAVGRFSIITRAMASFCASQHIALLYVVIPDPGRGVSAYPYGSFMETLIGTDLNLPYLPTSRLLKPQDAIPGDGHLTVEGNRIVADALVPFLSPYLK